MKWLAILGFVLMGYVAGTLLLPAQPLIGAAGGGVVGLVLFARSGASRPAPDASGDDEEEGDEPGYCAQCGHPLQHLVPLGRSPYCRYCGHHRGCPQCEHA